jgi:hypothetical protein
MFKLSSRISRTSTVALLALGLTLSVANAAPVKTLTFADFEDGALSPSGWVVGAQHGGTTTVSADTSKNLNGSRGSLRATYPIAPGDIYAWAVYKFPESTNDIYLDFWAKMPGPKQGVKFVKIFGGYDGAGYANTTFGLDYTGADGDYGDMYQVSFGDGSAKANDTAAVINFNGSYPQWIGRSFGKANVETPQKKRFSAAEWGSDWHHFKLHVKYNSGTTAENEVADGEYFVEIDGKVYVSAKGLFNRHPSNLPIERIELLNWAQNGKEPFEVWYDDIRITTGGFLQPSAPKPPALAPAK